MQYFNNNQIRKSTIQTHGSGTLRVLYERRMITLRSKCIIPVMFLS